MSKDMTAARAGKAATATTRKNALTEQVQDLLANPRVNDELKRKLGYVQSELDRGRIDPSLGDRRAEFIKEAERGIRRR